MFPTNSLIHSHSPPPSSAVAAAVWFSNSQGTNTIMFKFCFFFFFWILNFEFWWILIYDNRKGRDNEQKKQWKCSKAWIEAEPVTTTVTFTDVITQPIGDSVTHIATKLLRVVGAKPRRWYRTKILKQSGSHLNGAGGVPSLSYVRNAVGEWPQMPEMQKLCFAGFSPWWRRHRTSAVHGRRPEDLETTKLCSTSICMLSVFIFYF